MEDFLCQDLSVCFLIQYVDSVGLSLWVNYRSVKMLINNTRDLSALHMN